MTDDSDIADFSGEGRHSKRALFKDALARTKSKFKRDDRDKEFTLSDDVNDFLAAGKLYTHEDDRLPPAPSLNSSASDLPLRQPSPRGIPVPRLDVSQSTRFPDARPLGVQTGGGGHDYLRPVDPQRERSQSFNSFKKRRPRPRNLSVSFDSRPPVIIGLGGDDAEQPPLEISRLKQPKSLSPMPQQRPGSNHSHSSQGSISSLRRKPVPSASNPFEGDDVSPPIRPVRRAPTGFDSIKSPADQEYEMSLGQPVGSHESASGQYRTPLISPRPIHPPVAPPQVRSPPKLVPASSHPGFPTYQNHPGTISKQEVVQVMVTDEGLSNQQQAPPPPMPYGAGPPPPPPPRRSPNATSIMPHQRMAHRQKPSFNETETMNHGQSGWL